MKIRIVLAALALALALTGCSSPLPTTQTQGPFVGTWVSTWYSQSGTASADATFLITTDMPLRDITRQTTITNTQTGGNSITFTEANYAGAQPDSFDYSLTLNSPTTAVGTATPTAQNGPPVLITWTRNSS